MKDHALSQVIKSQSCRDTLDSILYKIMGIDAPGAVALLCPDSRLMVWANENDSLCDDGRKAKFRSPYPISKDDWKYIKSLAFIEKGIEL